VHGPPGCRLPGQRRVGAGCPACLVKHCGCCLTWSAFLPGLLQVVFYLVDLLQDKNKEVGGTHKEGGGTGSNVREGQEHVLHVLLSMGASTCVRMQSPGLVAR
jgi:hypothetical protein